MLCDIQLLCILLPFVVIVVIAFSSAALLLAAQGMGMCCNKCVVLISDSVRDRQTVYGSWTTGRGCVTCKWRRCVSLVDFGRTSCKCRTLLIHYNTMTPCATCNGDNSAPTCTSSTGSLVCASRRYSVRYLGDDCTPRWLLIGTNRSAAFRGTDSKSWVHVILYI